MEKSVSTIIITGMHQQQTLSFEIKTLHLKRLKYYFLLFVICLILLGRHVMMLSEENKKGKTANLYLKEEVKKLKIQIPPIKKDSNKVETYLESIQDKLKKINLYLKKRGVNALTALGGSKQDDNLSAEEKVKQYNSYLLVLMKQVESTPMGYPHYSSYASGYGYRSNPFTSEGSEFHSGVDIRGNSGDIVKSTARGKVIGAGWYQGYGKCVRILHANNYQTLYAHLSDIKVQVGERVKAGDHVGNIGSTGRSTGPHLHYEVRHHNKPLDPRLFLKI